MPFLLPLKSMVLTQSVDFMRVKSSLNNCLEKMLSIIGVIWTLIFVNVSFGHKVCLGTNKLMTVPADPERHFLSLKERYTNCTYVNGNLELVFLNSLDDSFLQHIQEVTGYILIAHIETDYLTLPNLQIIRGEELYRGTNYGDFALFVALTTLKEINLTNLKEINRGKVAFIDNFNLCHIKTIQWDDIISYDVELPQFVYAYNYEMPERECTACSEDCNGLCWGEEKTKCQELNKLVCHSSCEGNRCFGNESTQCCHEFCAAGCTGPTLQDCLACRYFSDSGVCTRDCSGSDGYQNKTTRYAYKTLCLEKCPEPFVIDNGSCVMECPDNKVLTNGECIACGDNCPISCSGLDVITATNIESFLNCSIVKGHITILQSSFTGYTEVHINESDIKIVTHRPLHPNQLSVFETVKEVTGFINIQASHPNFTTLAVFKNLEVIGGRAIMEDNAALFITESSLEFLDLQSLKSIDAGGIMIVDNSNLCLSETVNWSKLTKSTTSRILIAGNQNKNTCVNDGKVCHSSCSDGCWGLGSDKCVSCKRYAKDSNKDCFEEDGLESGNDLCKNSSEGCETPCNKSKLCLLPKISCPKGSYANMEMKEMICLPCNPLCLHCSDASDKCSECTYYSHNNSCVTTCPANTFSDKASKQCVPCFFLCRLGCFGPSAEHCRACDGFRLYEEDNKFSCVSDCPANKPNHIIDKDLPDKVCSDLASSSSKEKSFISSLKNTKLCNNQCKKSCNGKGPDRCYQCKSAQDDSVCLVKCPTTKYKDSKSICQPCHKDCVTGCSGPKNNIGKEGCHSCHVAVEKGNIKSPMIECLPVESSCPSGYYSFPVSKITKGKLQALAGKVLCKKCHPLCKRCSGPGDTCDECQFFSLKKKCVSKCPSMHFADKKEKLCVPCAKVCKKGCSGSTPSDCMNCKTVRINLEKNKFICASSCPKDKPKKVRDHKLQETICVPYGNTPKN